MSDDLQSTAPYDSIEEELVAYLDGELDEEASQQVELRLRDDAAYQQKLRELQKTWDLLDNLPRASVGEKFTQTTVELVAMKAAADAHKHEVGRATRQWIARGGTLAAAVVAGVVGYLSITSVASRSNMQLVRDLPVIENLDGYRNIESIEFLEQLDKSGLFAEAEVDHEQ